MSCGLLLSQLWTIDLLEIETLVKFSLCVPRKYEGWRCFSSLWCELKVYPYSTTYVKGKYLS